MAAIRGRVSESGRLGLPAEFRKAVGLDRGGDVVIELDGHDIRIRTVRDVVAHAQALTKTLLADKTGAGVDTFLIERREDAEREE